MILTSVDYYDNTQFAHEANDEEQWVFLENGLKTMSSLLFSLYTHFHINVSS